MIHRVGEWGGQTMADSNKNNCLPYTPHDLYQPRIKVVCAKNIFHLFRSSQPVENITLVHCT